MGEGVVGDGVLMGVGNEVGAGVGTQVVQSRNTSFVVQDICSEIFHISEPIGGVCPYSPVVSQIIA